MLRREDPFGNRYVRLLKLLMVLFVCSAGTTVAGCADASVPMATAEADVQGKSFSPLPDRGVIYFYRESKFASALSVWVVINQQHTVGALATGTWFRVALNPGRYVILCGPRESILKNSELLLVARIPTIIQVAADETYFVEIGFDSARCVSVERPAEEGRAAVLASRRAAENPAFTSIAAPSSVVATPPGPITIIYRDDVTNVRTLKSVARYGALLGRDSSVPFIVDRPGSVQKYCEGTFTKEGPNNGKFALLCDGGVSANGSYERKTGDRNDSFIARGQTSRGFPIELIVGLPAAGGR